LTGLTRRLGPLAVVLVLAAGLPARAETLADALVSAYNHSHLLDQNRALLRAADEDVAVALADLRPILSYAATAGIANNAVTGDTLSQSLSISADLLLYDFGRTKLGVELARESVLASRETLINVEQTVLYNAVQAYMNVIRSGEFVALRQNNVRLITEELRAARDRFELGEVTQTDVSIAEARLALARANLAAADGQLESAREQYRASVGHFPGQLSAAPAAPRTATTLADAKAIAQRTHPAIRQAQREVTIAELSIAIAEAAMKPSLTANASASTSNAATSPSGSIGLRFSGPIYMGGKLSALYRKAVARRDATRANLLQTANIAEQNVGLAWSQLNVASAQFQSSERQISAARIAYRGVREEATLGARTTLDVLNSEQELLDAEANRISSYTDFYVATYGLLREMGLLTAEHLRLGVVVYDPEAYYNAVKTGPIRKISPQGEKLDRILKGIGRN
jgi:outer membrane protein